MELTLSVDRDGGVAARVEDGGWVWRTLEAVHVGQAVQGIMRAPGAGGNVEEVHCDATPPPWARHHTIATMGAGLCEVKAVSANLVHLTRDGVPRIVCVSWFTALLTRRTRSLLTGSHGTAPRRVGDGRRRSTPPRTPPQQHQHAPP
eukprot:gene10432-27365_t